jgi:hypothetical protein
MRALNVHRSLSLTMGAYAALSLLFGAMGAKWWRPDRPLDGLCLGLFLASVVGQLIPVPFICRKWLGLEWKNYASKFLGRPGMVMICTLPLLAVLGSSDALVISSVLGKMVAVIAVGLGTLWVVVDRREKSWINAAAERMLIGFRDPAV